MTLRQATKRQSVFTEAGRIQWTDAVLVVLRVALGLVMLRMAYRLAFHGGWDALGSLGSIVPSAIQGPVGDIVMGFYGNQLVLGLMIAGAGFVGLSLVSGMFVRLGALVGTLMAVAFYLSSIPPADGWVNTHVLYILGFLVVSISGSGYRLGVDGLLRRIEERYPLLRYLTG